MKKHAKTKLAISRVMIANLGVTQLVHAIGGSSFTADSGCSPQHCFNDPVGVVAPPAAG